MPLKSQILSQQDAKKGLRPTPMRPLKSRIREARRRAQRQLFSKDLTRFLAHPYRWVAEASANFARAPEGTKFYALATSEGDAYAFAPSKEAFATIRNEFASHDGHEEIARDLGIYTGLATGQTARNGNVCAFSVEKKGNALALFSTKSYFNVQLGNDRTIPDVLEKRIKDELLVSEQDWLAEKAFEQKTFAKLVENLPPSVRAQAEATYEVCAQLIWQTPNLLLPDICQNLKNSVTAMRKVWRDCKTSGYQPGPSDSLALAELNFQIVTAAKHGFKFYQLPASDRTFFNRFDSMDLINLDAGGSFVLADFAIHLIESESDMNARTVGTTVAYLNFIGEFKKLSTRNQVINQFFTSRLKQTKNLPDPLSKSCRELFTLLQNARDSEYDMTRDDQQVLREGRQDFLDAREQYRNLGMTLDPNNERLIDELRRTFNVIADNIFSEDLAI